MDEQPALPPRERWIDFDLDAIPQDDEVFPLANLAGELRPNSVLLAAYIADRAPKHLRIWRPTLDRRQQQLVKEVVVEPDATGFVKLLVDELFPGTWYRYAYFDVDGDRFLSRSLVGAFRTAPSPDDLELLTVAISACNGGMAVPDAPIVPFQYPAMEVTAEQDYDMFVHLGDQAYMDRIFAAGGSLDQYLEGWKWYLGSRGHRACYARAGMFATWDDHEVTDNLSFSAWTTDPQALQKRDHAKTAFFKVLPIAGDGPDTRLWRSFRWGRTAELFILDSRYERKQPRTGEYLSPDQMSWLKERLAHSPCHFKIVANSVPITDLRGVHDIVKFDRWEGYTRDRKQLLQHINDRNIENVWFLAGDQHVNFVSRLNPEGIDLASRTREIGCTGGNTRLNLSGPHIAYSRAQARGVVLTFDPFRNVVHTRFIDPETGADDYAADLRQ